MAELAFDLVTNEIQTMMSDGRERDAIEMATQNLRAGYCTPEFLEVVARLLNPPPKKVGRPSHWPIKWLDIGCRSKVLDDAGETYEQRLVTLSQEFNQSEKSVERAVRFFRKAEEEHARILREG